MRKRYEPNEIILCKDHAELIIYNKDLSENCRVLIDIEDINKVGNTVWSIGSGGYIRSNHKILKINASIHRVIMNVVNNPAILIDHINMNKLDNRKVNLRFADKSKNSMNRETQINNTYGFRGISFDKRRGKFRAYIKLHGKQIFLGYHNNFESAKQARLLGEEKYFKEFSNKTELTIPLEQQFKKLNLI